MVGRFFLIAHQPSVVFVGRVTGSLVSPYMTVPYYGGVGAAIPGETVFFGSGPTGTDKGMCRLRTAPAGGTFTVGENYDTVPYLATDDYISITEDFRLWAIAPRITGATAFFEDWNTLYTDQNQAWAPVAVAGPPGIALMAGGAPGTCAFVGAASYAVAPGATIASYLWTANGSVEGTSANAGTVGAPVVFTWNAAGQYLVSLKVTDSVGKTHTTYTYAFVFDPEDPPSWVFRDFDEAGENGAWDKGGWELDCTVRTRFGESVFPPGTLIVHAMEGSLTTPTASWPHRENILFVGRILEGTVFTDPNAQSVSFRAATIDETMRNIYPYPGRLTDSASPTMWVQGYQLTIDRLFNFLALRRSTLASMTPLMPSNIADRVYQQDFDTTTLYDQFSTQIMESAWGKLCCTSQGVLYPERDAQVMLAAERLALTTRKALTNQIWLNRLEIGTLELEGLKTGYVDSSGVAYSGTATGVPLFSEAPGPVPRFRGGSERADNKIVQNQTELNARTGHFLAKKNNPYPKVSAQFLDDGSFDIVPQEYFPMTLDGTDNAKGLVWSAKKCIPRTIRRQYNHMQGSIAVNVDFEPETTGNPGMTVIAPTLTGTVQPPPTQCPTGWHWDTSVSGCVQDEPPGVGTGKVVLIAVRTNGGTARVARTRDIFAASPVWEAIDDGGFAGIDPLYGGLKLDPWADTRACALADARYIRYCADYTAAVPVWTTILDIQTKLAHANAVITDYHFNVEEEGVIVVTARIPITVPGDDKGYILCTHDRGTDGWNSFQLPGMGGFWPDDCRPWRFDLDERPYISETKPYAYIRCQNQQTQKFRSFKHNADHTWTNVFDVADLSTNDILDLPSIPYLAADDGDWFWLRYIYAAKSSAECYSALHKVDGAGSYTDITPGSFGAGNRYGAMAECMTWDKNMIYVIGEGAGAGTEAKNIWMSPDAGANWTQKTDLPKGARVRCVSFFPYNQLLIYALTSPEKWETGGHINDVMMSNDGADTWLDKTGNLDTALNIAAPNYAGGRGIVATWTSD